MGAQTKTVRSALAQLQALLASVHDIHQPFWHDASCGNRRWVQNCGVYIL